LNEDPFEMKNIYNPNNTIVKKLKPVLKHWLQKTNDGFTIEEE
jgi:hypothetical protein